LRSSIEKAGLTLDHVETFGASYAATLAEWRVRFHRAWPEVEKIGFPDKFRRLWEYYLCYCEAGFRTGAIDVGLYCVSHVKKAPAR
jgi:cyclopropane-fatty-acyl-phospholipid synthase